MISTQVYINDDKVRADQPDVVGKWQIDGAQFRVALWNQVTKAGDKDYYAGSLGLDAKDSPKTRIKMYQFRKAKTEDPDYGTTDSFELAGETYFAYLSIRPDPEGLQDLVFSFELSPEPRRPKASAEIAQFQKRLEKYKTPAPVSVNADGEPDDLPF